MARKPKAAKKARKKPAKNSASRKKRMRKPGKMAHKATRKKTSKPAAASAVSKPSRKNDTTMNALFFLVLIMIVLGSGFLSLQHYKSTAATAPASVAMEKK